MQLATLVLLAAPAMALVPPASLLPASARPATSRFAGRRGTTTRMVSIPFFGTKERSRKELREGIAGFYDRCVGGLRLPPGAHAYAAAVAVVVVVAVVVTVAVASSPPT